MKRITHRILNPKNKQTKTKKQELLFNENKQLGYCQYGYQQRTPGEKEGTHQRRWKCLDNVLMQNHLIEIIALSNPRCSQDKDEENAYPVDSRTTNCFSFSSGKIDLIWPKKKQVEHKWSKREHPTGVNLQLLATNIKLGSTQLPSLNCVLHVPRSTRRKSEHEKI